MDSMIFVLIALGGVSADISHLFPSGFGFFQQPPLPPPQHINGVYGPPPILGPTTEFFIPEVIVNRKNVNFNQYVPPSAEDSPPSHPNLEYLQPTAGNHRDPNLLIVYDQAHSGYDYHEPSTTTTTTSSPPPIEDTPFEDLTPPEETQPADGYNYDRPQQPQPEPPQGAYLPPSDGRSLTTQSSLRVHVHEMRCLHSHGGYFKAVLKVDTPLAALPIIDHDTADSKCDVKLARSYLAVDVAGADFAKCGIRSCGQNLCLRIRFPAIGGMRTAGDSILTLQCKTQDRVVAKTHSIKVGVANDVQARSLGSYAQGGSQQQFRTHIELLRKSPNGFTKHLEPNGAVQLGEDLLLRAHVIAGDGWNYTKLTDVNLQRLGRSGEVLTSVNLIGSSGCTNPSMRSICPFSPIFEAPLGHRLAFKAVMFQGMKSGDEIVMSMKIAGCLEHHDCHVSAQTCSDAGVGRAKRSSDGNGTEFSEISRIAFRVETGEALSEFRASARNWYVIGGVCGFVGLLSLLGLVVYVKTK